MVIFLGEVLKSILFKDVAFYKGVRRYGNKDNQ